MCVINKQAMLILKLNQFDLCNSFKGLYPCISCIPNFGPGLAPLTEGELNLNLGKLRSSQKTTANGGILFLPHPPLGVKD